MSKQPTAARTPARDDTSAPGSRTDEGETLGLQLALDAERRLHDGLADALLGSPDLSPTQRRYRQTRLDMRWTCGESSPFEITMAARTEGDAAIMRRALDDAKTLADLRREAYP